MVMIINFGLSFPFTPYKILLTDNKIYSKIFVIISYKEAIKRVGSIGLVWLLVGAGLGLFGTISFYENSAAQRRTYTHWRWNNDIHHRERQGRFHIQQAHSMGLRCDRWKWIWILAAWDGECLWNGRYFERVYSAAFCVVWSQKSCFVVIISFASILHVEWKRWVYTKEWGLSREKYAKGTD